MIVGLDIGFGDTKIVTKVISEKFPTAISHYEIPTVSLGAFGVQDKTYYYKGKKYIVGQNAIMDALPTRNIDFLFNFSPILISYARTFVDFDTIAVGLPLGYFNRAADFKKELSNFTINNKNMSYKVSVLPQGIGVLFDHIFNWNNKVSDCLVIDVGFNTVDILAVMDGKAVSKFSGMLENRGVCLIINEIINYIKRTYNKDVNEQEAKDILLKKSYKNYGKEYDMKRIISKMSSEYADRLLSDIMQRWDKILERTGQILLSGGGAYYLNNNIPEKYEAMISIVRPDAPEYANAAGFYRFIQECL